jgi:hypothetical protein
MEKLHKQQTVNECGTFGGMRIGKVLGENAPQHHFAPPPPQTFKCFTHMNNINEYPVYSPDFRIGHKCRASSIRTLVQQS